jgi:hypothetical protein
MALEEGNLYESYDKGYLNIRKLTALPLLTKSLSWVLELPPVSTAEDKGSQAGKRAEALRKDSLLAGPG